MPVGFRDSGQMCQVARRHISKKIMSIKSRHQKNWLAEARQFQISMSERTDCTGKVGLSQNGKSMKNFVAHFNYLGKNLPFTRSNYIF